MPKPLIEREASAKTGPQARRRIGRWLTLGTSVSLALGAAGPAVGQAPADSSATLSVGMQLRLTVPPLGPRFRTAVTRVEGQELWIRSYPSLAELRVPWGDVAALEVPAGTRHEYGRLSLRGGSVGAVLGFFGGLAYDRSGGQSPGGCAGDGPTITCGRTGHNLAVGGALGAGLGLATGLVIAAGTKAVRWRSVSLRNVHFAMLPGGGVGVGLTCCRANDTYRPKPSDGSPP